MRYLLIADGVERDIDVDDQGDAREAAHEWARARHKSASQTYWVNTHVVAIDDDGNELDLECVTTTIDPVEPPCGNRNSDDHERDSPLQLVGGCASNPGAFAHDGGAGVITVDGQRCYVERGRSNDDGDS